MRTHLLVTTAAVALLAAGTAQAQDATWVGTTNSYTTPTNWSTNSVPTGTAFFGGSGNSSVSITTFDGTVGGWTLNSNAQNYSFSNESLSRFSFNGAGIIVNGGSATITNTATLLFGSASTAGSATITNSPDSPFVGGNLSFRDASTAGNAAITNNGSLSFENSSTAGNATITNNEGSLSFNNTSTAGNATITNNDIASFNDTSRAGNATIINNAKMARPCHGIRRWHQLAGSFASPTG